MPIKLLGLLGLIVLTGKAHIILCSTNRVKRSVVVCESLHVGASLMRRTATSLGLIPTARAARGSEPRGEAWLQLGGQSSALMSVELWYETKYLVLL